MRNFLIFVVATIAFAGCSSTFMQRLKDSTNERTIHEKEERQLAEKREAERKALLKEGVSTAEFEKAWGRPDETEMKAGSLFWHYDQSERPMILEFKGGTLAGWQTNKELVDERKRKGLSCYSSCFAGICSFSCNK